MSDTTAAHYDKIMIETRPISAMHARPIEGKDQQPMASGEIAGKDILVGDRQEELAGEAAFFGQVKAEMERAARSGAPGTLAYIGLLELPEVVQRVGLRGEAEVRQAMAGLLLAGRRPLEVAGQDGRGRFMLLLPETGPAAALLLLERLAQRIAAHEFRVRGEPQSFTPRIGLAAFEAGGSLDALRLQSQQALQQAIHGGEPAPLLYDPSRPVVARRRPRRRANRQPPRWLLAALAPLEEPLDDISASARERWDAFQAHPASRAWGTLRGGAASAVHGARSVLARALPEPAAARLRDIRDALFDQRTRRQAARLSLVLLVLLFVANLLLGWGLVPAALLLLLPLLFATTLVWTAVLQDVEGRRLQAAVARRVRAVLPRRDMAATNRLRRAVLAESAFSREFEREVLRTRRGGAPGTLAVLRLGGLEQVGERLGRGATRELETRLARLLLVPARPLDLLGRGMREQLTLLMPETGAHEAGQWLDEIARRLREMTFEIAGEQVRLDATVGFAPFESGATRDETQHRALTALEYAVARPGDEPAAYDALMETMSEWAGREGTPRRRRSPAALRRPLALGAALLLGMVIPFLVLASLDALFDPAPLAYAIVCGALAVDLWLLGTVALRRSAAAAPPEEPEAFPEASAIITARLPDDAPLLIATVEAFLHVEYPAPRTLILAYSAPDEERVDPVLEEVSRRHRRLTLLRLGRDATRADLLGGALEMAGGEMIALFEAGNHPAPDSFRRAWRRLAAGYDVVQGHSPARNAAASVLSAAGAVDAEARYVLDGSGREASPLAILSSSNSYWRAAALLETPVQALAADREVPVWRQPAEDGYSIAADPDLLATTPAPVKWPGFWRRLGGATRARMVSPRFARRRPGEPAHPLSRRIELLRLTGWRLLFPWLAGLFLPLAAFVFWKAVQPPGYEPLWPLLVPVGLLFLIAAVQALLAYRVAPRELRRSWPAFLFYPFAATLILAELKHLAARMEYLDQLFAPRTPRPPKAG